MSFTKTDTAHLAGKPACLVSIPTSNAGTKAKVVADARDGLSAPRREGAATGYKQSGGGGGPKERRPARWSG